MRRVNIQAAFVGEPTASQEGLEADDDAEAVVLAVRGGEVTFVVPGGTPLEELASASSVLRGTLRLEHERVLSFEIQEGATGAYFEDEPAELHARREAEPAVGMFSGTSGPGPQPAGVARDVMTREVVTVAPSASIQEAADLLAFHRVSGLPVVEDGRLVGLVSEADLLGKRGATVAEIMTRQVVSVSETTPLAEVAALLLQHGIKRVPVLHEGRLVGLVSRGDLVRMLAAR